MSVHPIQPALVEGVSVPTRPVVQSVARIVLPPVMELV